MKKNLFLYLFVFALIISLFTYMYFRGEQKYVHGRIATIQKQLKASRDSLRAAKEDAAYFALKGNDNALEYFIEKGITNTDSLTVKIEEGVLLQNENPQGNALTGYEPMNGQKFMINKVHILNHRWIIADYSNGSAWGDVLIRYFVEDDGKITYETIQSMIYSNTVK